MGRSACMRLNRTDRLQEVGPTSPPTLFLWGPTLPPTRLQCRARARCCLGFANMVAAQLARVRGCLGFGARGGAAGVMRALQARGGLGQRAHNAPGEESSAPDRVPAARAFGCAGSCPARAGGHSRALELPNLRSLPHHPSMATRGWPGEEGQPVGPVGLHAIEQDRPAAGSGAHFPPNVVSLGPHAPTDAIAVPRARALLPWFRQHGCSAARARARLPWIRRPRGRRGRYAGASGPGRLGSAGP